MTVKYFALLTNLGAAKLANAAALGTPLQITQMVVGDGGGALPTPNPAQTQLIAEKRRAALNSLSIDAANSSQIIAEQVIPETDGGWWIREIGLLDKDGVLIAIANCPETYKPQLQEGSGRTQTVRMVLIVSSTEAVTLKIDPSVVLATRKYADDKAIEVKQYADNLLVEHEKSRNHPDASKTEKGFVKLSSATTSDSEVLAATPKAVKTVSEAAAKALDDHGKADDPHQQYLQMAQLTGVIGTSRNAKMSVTIAAAAATFTADEVIVQTALGGRQYKLTNVNKLISLANTGAGGMDAGTVPANGFVALYVIYNPTTQALALLAVNTTSILAPEICAGAMPSDYTASALVSVWRTANSQFVIGYQLDRRIITPVVPATTSNSLPANYIAIGLAAIVPVNAKSVTGWVGITTTAPANNQIFVASSATGIYEHLIQSAPITTLNTPLPEIPLITPQAFYYKATSNGAVSLFVIDINGYTF
ncbi:tail fiber protein [Yersinia rohdei]|uniref:phage tail protein n=1 Tax=Yersinia rohdei TaxID=29485 RepID=UPI00061BF0B0|nr:phage tail protein [Yersinia rohdei]CNF41440.1 tail fiber protein [Yersinia rohdei]